MFDNNITREVGVEEASMWGAYLTDYEYIEVDDEPLNPIVRYYAVEHDEAFYFDMRFSEVYQKAIEYRKYRESH